MLNFKALRTVVADLHGEGGSSGALNARFKYLQRMGFPGGSNVGRGSRAQYRLEDVLALALAFEIQEISATPVRVVRLLRDRWPEIARALVAAWASIDGLGGAAMCLAHLPGALREMGVADATAPATDPLLIVEPDQVVDWMRGGVPGGSPSLYIIDLARFVRRLSMSMVAVGGVGPNLLNDAFLRMGDELFDGDGPRRWVVAADRLAASGG